VTHPALPRSGEGTIDPLTARVLTVGFLVLIAVPAACQTVDRGGVAVLQAFSGDLRTEGFQKALQHLETRIDREAVFPSEVRGPYREVLLRTLGQTAETTCLGRDGFLFYRDDLKFARGPGYLSARQATRIAEARDLRGDAFEEAIRSAVRRVRGLAAPPPPSEAPYVSATATVRDTVRQLRERGLSVLLVPIPGKVAIYPEFYAPSYPPDAGPAENRDQARWKDLLEAEGIPVVELAGPLWEAKGRSANLLYLKTDSHWSPDGLAVAADAIAARSLKALGPVLPARFDTKKQTVDYTGDQLKLLDIRDAARFFPPERITLTHVLHGTAANVVGDDASVLLLGDSYTTMFRGDDPASEAGLAAQLMLRLGCGVQTIAREGITPAALLQELGRRPEALAHKKLVIWTFADRTVVTVKSWELVPQPTP
jgi:alginate O-acetyltransferase complex protein AlgJ